MVLDLIVFGILIASAAVAFMRGFVREVLTIGSLGGAAAATLVFGPTLSPVTREWIVDPTATEPQQLFGIVPYEMLAPMIAYAIVFVGVLIVLTIVTHMVSRGVHAVGLGPVDRSLGVAFGLVRGIVIVGLLSLVMNFAFSDTQRRQFFGDSKTYPYVSYLADLTNALLPGREVLDKINHDDDSSKETKDLKTRANMALPPTGSQPLEPGQKISQKKAPVSYSAGYSRAQRQKMDDLTAAPADVKPSPVKPASGFNN